MPAAVRRVTTIVVMKQSLHGTRGLAVGKSPVSVATSAFSLFTASVVNAAPHGASGGVQVRVPSH
jgi:hypothetical protein